jgi:hypothetical protein
MQEVNDALLSSFQACTHIGDQHQINQASKLLISYLSDSEKVCTKLVHLASVSLARGGEGMLVIQHFVGDTAERPDVGLFAEGLFFEDLGRVIPPCLEVA